MKNKRERKKHPYVGRLYEIKTKNTNIYFTRFGAFCTFCHVIYSIIIYISTRIRTLKIFSQKGLYHVLPYEIVCGTSTIYHNENGLFYDRFPSRRRTKSYITIEYRYTRRDQNNINYTAL